MFRTLGRAIILGSQRSFMRPQLLQKSIFMGTAFTFGGLMLKTLKLDNYEHAQSTVVSDNHTSCAVVVLKISPSHTHQVVKALKEVSHVPQELNASEKADPEDGKEGFFKLELYPLMVGVGFSTPFWQNLTNTQHKHHKHRSGKHGDIPDTNADVILHIKGQTHSLCLEAVQKTLDKLPKGSFTVVHEKYGYKYKDGRDLSGFLDGTMNPATPVQRTQNAVIEKTGGSYLIHQVWRHDLEFLNTIPVHEQERWVGRVKATSQENKQLDVESHVRRTRDANGQRILIVRQSMPYGDVSGDHGLLFLAYSNDVDKFDVMLDRMTGVPDGHNDSIMKFSRCIFSNYFYVPSVQEIQQL